MMDKHLVKRLSNEKQSSYYAPCSSTFHTSLSNHSWCSLWPETARDIQNKFPVTITRHAVRERGENYQAVFQGLDLDLTNEARTVLRNKLNSENEMIQFKAAEFILKYLGSWTEKKQIEVTRDRPIFIVEDDPQKNATRLEYFENKRKYNGSSN